jgi:hypothetical protein
MSGLRLVIAGQRGGTCVGESFAHAAGELGHALRFVDEQEAHRGPLLARRIGWHLCGRRPVRLETFGRMVADVCAAERADVLLCTGHAPVSAVWLDRINDNGTRSLCFATDDPWNRAQRAPWFLRALPHYGWIFSPRAANLDQFRKHGCSRVKYLPFAYDPRHFFRETISEADRAGLACDLLFVGGADRDREPILESLAHAGVDLAVYGAYWDRVAAVRPHWRGQAGPAVLRRASQAARVNLCLVRRANRDDHVMRSYEIAASGGCVLAEDTPAHRRLFGEEGAAYFSTQEQVREALARLLADPALRQRQAEAAHRRVVDGHNSYRDRLNSMLATAGVGEAAT